MGNRRKRTDSIDVMIEQFNSLSKDLSPPDHCVLHDGAEPFYMSIVECRSPEMWNTVDLSRAVELANTQLAIQREKTELAAEGSVVTTDKGTPMQNPRIGVISMYSRLEIALGKALQTDAVSTQGRGRDVRNKNASHAKTKAKSVAISDDPLLSGMH